MSAFVESGQRLCDLLSDTHDVAGKLIYTDRAQQSSLS